MLVQIVSDVHLEQQTIPIPVVADILVVAGDLVNAARVADVLTSYSHCWKHVVYVPGNHEYYGLSVPEANALISRHVPENVHVLMNSTVTIEGQRFVGSTLWSRPTSLRRINDALRIKGCTSESMAAWNSECRDYLQKTMREGDVVITHFMPVKLPDLIAAGHKSPYAPDAELDAYFGNADIDLSPAKMWIFGHTHDAIDIQVRGTHLVCNPIGYPGEDTRYKALAWSL